MKILLLGKDGQVGTELKRTLLPLGHLIAIGRADYNLDDLSGLKQLLNQHQPDIIVNAAAYTAVDKAESDTDAAFQVNAYLLSVLAEFAKEHQCLLVHYSTDYVFDGLKQTPYTETDAVNPQSVYGASKRLGEEAILNSGCEHLIFRTSWVFSAHGKNFIKTILQLAKERDSLRIVADQFGAPTSAEFIADVTALAIARFIANPANIQGIYHLTAKGSTSWHQLACYAVDKALQCGMTLKLNSQNIQPIPTEEYPVPAVRPKNSRLDINALTSTFNLHVPDWNIYVDRLIQQLTSLEHSA